MPAAINIQRLSPALTITPVQLTRPRFAGRHEHVVVLHVLGLPGTGRLSFPAFMPVTEHCELHVVVHARTQAPCDFIPCLADLRRIAVPPGALWMVVLLPPVCTLQEVQASLTAQCPAAYFPTAIYLNSARVLNQPIAVHRHTVITPLGSHPIEGLDAISADGTFMPYVWKGCDVAATRSGLARFLAPSAAVGEDTRFVPTTTSTTAHSCGPGQVFAGPRPITQRQAPAAAAQVRTDRHQCYGVFSQLLQSPHPTRCRGGH